VAALRRIDSVPFDYERQMMSVLVETPECKRTLICKGAPEAIVKKCSSADPSVRARLDAQFDTGNRVVALATRDATKMTEIHPSDEAVSSSSLRRRRRGGKPGTLGRPEHRSEDRDRRQRPHGPGGLP
jgi:magnesium-transporting ATPase (P-type)